MLRSGWFDRQWYAEHSCDVVPTERKTALDHYLRVGAPAGLAPNAVLDSLQAPNGWSERTAPDTGPVPDLDDPQLALEVALVRASGLFDAAFYSSQEPILALGTTDPVVHFCRVGWRHLTRPNADFDVWWYWSNHLDPRRELINPLVHYIVCGRAAGYSGAPPPDPEPRTFTLSDERPIRRVCLFAGYDAEGVLDDYVVDYVRELSRFADVYYLCDGHLDAHELAKLDGIAAGAWAIRHGAYDFGSYSMLAKDLVGWEKVATYDELLLVNDSCYLLRELDHVFARMDSRDCAWWGLQATKGIAATRHSPANAFTEPIPIDRVREELLVSFEQDPVYDFLVGSYFLAFRQPVINDQPFRRILDSVHPQRSKLTIIMKYEIGLTHHLVGNGYRFDTFVDDLYPFHPIFTAWYFVLLEAGFPLLKRYLLHRNHYDVPGLKDWRQRVLAVAPGARLEPAQKNLDRVAPHDELTRSFAVVTDEDGQTAVPQVLSGSSFQRADHHAPTFDHWWAFPVSFDQHLLSDNSRAIFEAVRDDPSIKKIVLTRSRQVILSGENVVVVPLRSPEGQHQLLRAGQVFVNDAPRTALMRWPMSHQHRIILVRDGLTMQQPERSRQAAHHAFRVREKPVLGAMLTSSDLDQLAMLTRHYPATYDRCWRTGLPATDFLLGPEEALPVDLQEQVLALRTTLDGRRLVLFAPAAGRSSETHAYRFAPDQVARLGAWARKHDVVLGLRENPRDSQRSYHRQLAGVTMDLSVWKYPSLPAVLRTASGVLTDFADAGLDFLATGRPVVSFVHDLPEVRDSLLCDPEHVLPTPVCRSFEELSSSLDTMFDELDVPERRRYARSQELFFDRVDDQNAVRVVQAVRQSSLVDSL